MLTTRIDLNLGAVLTSALDLSSEAKAAINMLKSISLSTGTGAGQADQLWFDTRQIAASGNDDLDLSGGLTNGLNQAANFAKIKGIVLFSYAANTNLIHIGGGLTPFASWLGADGDIVKVVPGGLFTLIAPNAAAYAVTATTADILRITNAAAGTVVDYDIVLFGTTA